MFGVEEFSRREREGVGRVKKRRKMGMGKRIRGGRRLGESE